MCFQNGLKTIGGSIAFEMWGMPMLASIGLLRVSVSRGQSLGLGLLCASIGS